MGLAAGIAAAGPPPSGGTAPSVPAPDAGRQALLNTRCFWRGHVTLRPELYGSAAAPRPRAKATVLTETAQAVGAPTTYTKLPALAADQPHSPAPPTEWAQPAFDDASWARLPGPFFSGETRTSRIGLLGIRHSQARLNMPLGLARLCVRGRFLVTDPARVRDLRLSAAYRGGIVVFLNGTEVARAHLPLPDRTDDETLAEDCPPETWTREDGAPYTDKELGALYGNASETNELLRPLWQRLERRVRRLEEVTLPARLLRKGVNILAVEVRRSAIASETVPFCPTGLVDIELAAAGDGAVSSLARPAGVQVWPTGAMEDVLSADFGDPDCAGRPVRIVGTRGGSFGGQVVVSSDEPIRALRAGVSDLVCRGAGGRIAAGQIDLAYPQPLPGAGRNVPRRSVPERLNSEFAWGFGALAPLPPATVAVQRKEYARPADRGYGAVQPIWLRVRVPADARPGAYEGAITVAAEGLPEAAVPVQLQVCNWVLPEPSRFRTLVDFVQSPDSLAQAYGVPLWSERHFALIDRSLALLAGAGDASIYLPLVAQTHFGNAESMVRWIRQPGGGFDFDCSVLERYLDLCLRHIPRPRVVCLQVYDYHLGTGGRHSGWFAPGADTYKTPEAVPVTFLDPASGKTEIGGAPLYGSTNSLPAWSGLVRQVWRRLEARGLGRLATLGLVGDLLPPKEYVHFWRELLPDTGWAMHSHGLMRQIHGDIPVCYNVFVYGTLFAVDPSCKRYTGWRREPPAAQYPRNADATQPRANIRLLAEWNIHGNQNGVGQLPGDYLPLPSGRPDRPLYLYDSRKVGLFWGNTGLGRSGPWLAPGPDGAVSTIRLELLREGVQECEARIRIEEALLDDARRQRLGPELAARAQALLDERTRQHQWVFRHLESDSGGASGVLPGNNLPIVWFAGSGWQDRAAALFALAAEVGEKLGERP